MFIIQDYMLNDLMLKGTDLLLFAYLSGKDVCEDSLEDLKNNVGVKSINTVRTSLKYLEDKGLIVITMNGTNKPNTIKVSSLSPTSTPPPQDEGDKFNPKKTLFKRLSKEDL